MSKNYKDTLNMPTSNFEMRANLASKEASYRQQWLDSGLYQTILKRNRNNQQFILHDGPPYANGDLHIGHALNKGLKDFIVRYKSMNGFYSPYVPGWDMHGLPIEHKMLTDMGKKHTEIDVVELRKAAAEYAKGQAARQIEQFQELQMLSDFKMIYETIRPDFEARQLKLFKKMFDDGLVYKGLKPIYWSPSSQSALAEAEVEYAEKTSPSIYVAFPLTKGNDKVKVGDNLVIWTTTPWTLVANAGVAVGENIDYVILENLDTSKRYIVANDLVEELIKLWKFENAKVVDHVSASDLYHLSYEHPLGTNSQDTKVVYGHHVDTSAGTGLVHMAPLFGEDDFIIGKAEGLEEIMHVADDGTFNKAGQRFAGLFYEDANKEIGLDLDKQGKLLKLNFIKHQYPHDWRTHKPIIFRGTPQWFVNIEDIREGLVASIDKVQGYPAWVVKRLSEMLAKRGPWTISRQRAWGVPIPIFYDKDGEVVNNDEIFNYVIALVEKHGTDIWYEKTTDELLPEKYRGLGYTKEHSIMDVWFDSGSTSISVQIEGVEEKEGHPIFDMYLEGTDQFRGWFNSSAINSYVWRKATPYKFLLSHGFVLDGKHQKMSKSKGNVITPKEVVSQYGADILRLWIASVEYGSDVPISFDLLKQVGETYRKIRNTLRFCLNNLEGYAYDKNVKLNGVHAFINNRLQKLKNDVIDAYEKFSFADVTRDVNLFLVDLSSFYLSFGKDILYADKTDATEREMMLKNLYEIVEVVLIALAPIMPTTAEEAYGVFNKDNKLSSVHLEKFFTKADFDQDLESTWKEFFTTKDEVYRLIEEAIAKKTIKRSNEVTVTIPTPSEKLIDLNWSQLLMVAKVNFCSVYKLETEETVKCPRCWNHHFDKNNDDLCNRCFSVLN